MLENLVFVAVVVLLLWLLSLGIYLYSSRQQLDLQKELKILQNLLDKKEKSR